MSRTRQRSVRKLIDVAEAIAQSHVLLLAPLTQARPTRPVDRAIVEVALDNQIDGYRMVAALVTRKLGEAVNRK